MLLFRRAAPGSGLARTATGRRALADDGSGAGLDGRNTGKYRRAYEFMVSPCPLQPSVCVASGAAPLPRRAAGADCPDTGALARAEEAPVQDARGNVAAEHGTRNRAHRRGRVDHAVRARRVRAAAPQGECAHEALAGRARPGEQVFRALTRCSAEPRVCVAKTLGEIRRTSIWSRSTPCKPRRSYSGLSWKANSAT